MNEYFMGGKFDEYTGRDEWYAVYTIQLGELVEKGVFDWTRPELDWESAKFNDEQYKRVCDYFIERFYYREISVEPFAEWARMVRRKLIYEIMPKYRPIYEMLSDGYDPLAIENEYYKNRTIESSYPETLLSGNSDYVSDGRDEEYQRIKQGNFIDMLDNLSKKYRSVDELVLDDLESMFISMYTLNVNSSW